MSISKHLVCHFSGKTNNFDSFSPNLSKNGFWGRNFKNLSPNPKSALPRYHVYQFSVKLEEVVELGEGGCSWMEVGVQFSNTG